MAKRCCNRWSLRFAATGMACLLLAAAARAEMPPAHDEIIPEGTYVGPTSSPFTIPAVYGAPLDAGPYAPHAPYPPDVEAPYGGHPNAVAPYAPNVCRYDRVWRSPLSAKLWARGTLLGWTSKQQRVPTLVTTSTAANPAIDTAGALGRPDTNVLFGGGDEQGEFHGGGGITLGYWFTPDRISGVELSWLAFEVGDAIFQGTSDDVDVLAVPFFNVGQNAQAVQAIVFPNLFDGSVVAEVDTEFNMADVIVRHMLRCTETTRLDVVFGYRHAHLADQLSVTGSSVALSAASGFEEDTEIFRRDHYYVSNKFHGGELGLNADFYHGRWRLDLLGKIAIGGVWQEAELNGLTVVDTPTAAAVTTEEGVLIRSTNRGSYGRSVDSMIYELSALVEYDFTCQWTVACGYTYLFWDGVSRVGESVDQNIDLRNGATQPGFQFNDNDWWAQGLTFRFEYLF